MERYSSGDQDAFDELHDLVAPRVYRFLVRQTRDRELSQDLLQQTLLQLHRARARFVPGAEVMPWLIVIARRLLINHMRNTRRIDSLTKDVAVQRSPPKTCEPDDVMHARQLLSLVESELSRLPAPQRAAFELLKKQGLSLNEAAQKLSISVAALKLRLHRAQLTLRAALACAERDIS